MLRSGKEWPSLVAVDVAAVHADVCGLLLLRRRQPAPEAGRDGPLCQPLYVDVLVLSLDL